MAYRYFTILWLFFVLMPWKFSNALPDWYKDPMPVKMNLMVSSEKKSVDFESPDGISALLCRLDMAYFYHGEEDNNSNMYRIWNPVTGKDLFTFFIGDVKFSVMSGNTFYITITTTDDNIGLLKGKFENFDDFKNFHILVAGEDAKYSPQNFTIVRLENYKNVNNYIYDDIKVLHQRPVIFSQYSIKNSTDFGFTIEDDEKSYLTFEPNKYSSTCYQIKSQVVLTLSDDETTYFILRFDTPTNASNFTTYISKFAMPEPLQIPNVLQMFLFRRG